MSTSKCQYDCSERPSAIAQNSDVSGLGGIIGYLFGAASSITILFVHYFTVYDPTQNPFRRDENGDGDAEAEPYQPNQIDLIFYSASYSRPRQFFQLLRYSSRAQLDQESTTRASRNRGRLGAYYLKYVRAMSDVQLWTGISLIVSGYAQLECGISCYHWRILVDLVWFASVTHMSCLTMLRNYLYNRPVERILRLISMAILVFMLIVAIVPTGNFGWYPPQAEPLPADYMICYFRPWLYGGHLAYITTLVSMVLLVVGFAVRVLRLIKSTDRDVLKRIRVSVSNRTRSYLHWFHRTLDIKRLPRSFRRVFLYRPLLCLFLLGGLIVDVWSSMIFEIWWLFCTFLWGVCKLVATRRVYGNDDNNDWTVGQVIPLVLIAVPLFAVVEHIFAREAPEAVAPENIGVETFARGVDTTPADMQPLGQDFDNPDVDCYQQTWFLLFVAIACLDIVLCSLEIIALLGTGVFMDENNAGILYSTGFALAPLTVTARWVTLLLQSLQAEDIYAALSPRLSAREVATRVVIYRGFLLLSYVATAAMGGCLFVLIFLLMYVLVACALRLVRSAAELDEASGGPAPTDYVEAQLRRPPV